MASRPKWVLCSSSSKKIAVGSVVDSPSSASKRAVCPGGAQETAELEVPKSMPSVPERVPTVRAMCRLCARKKGRILAQAKMGRSAHNSAPHHRWLSLMIVRPRPHWLRMLFVRRGSLLPRILGQLVFIVTLSTLVVLLHGQVFHWKVTLTSVPFSLMGVALAIFLGFRINASYDRYWEARKQWGVILVETRNLARKSLAMVGPVQEVRPFVYALAGCAATVRHHLRAESPDPGTAHLLPPEL